MITYSVYGIKLTYDEFITRFNIGDVRKNGIALTLNNIEIRCKELLKNTKLIFIMSEDDTDIIIGRDYSTIEDNETGLMFKQLAEQQIKTFCTDLPIIHQEGSLIFWD